MTTTAGSYNQPSQYTNYVASAVGINVWSQGIWNDTKTNNAMLTRTSRCVLPAIPPPADFNGTFAYRYGSPTVPNPTTSLTPGMAYVPLFRYK
jgi:hypothetical protein